jgi:quercetin dioxygenase-like cupin family protein
MAIERAAPGQAIDIGPLGAALESQRTSALVKTDTLEVMRLVLPAGKTVPSHAVKGEITVQCLEGKVEFTAAGSSLTLTQGQLLYLAGGVPHALAAVEDASVLVTVLLVK